jgi:hypothetical protein
MSFKRKKEKETKEERKKERKKERKRKKWFAQKRSDNHDQISALLELKFLSERFCLSTK